jgi:mannose PTS system EIIA component
MIHGIIAAHGKLAEAFLNSAEMIVGNKSTSGVNWLSMTEDKSMDQFCLEIQEIIASSPKDDFLIFADVFGASPCNSCLSMFRNSNYRVITGVNLPMLLEFFTRSENVDLDTLWKSLIDCGKESIRGINLRSR